MKDASSRSQHVLVRVVAADWWAILFEDEYWSKGCTRGRNGAGKTTLIRWFLASGKSFDGGPVLYPGDIFRSAGSNWCLEQEIDLWYLSDPRSDWKINMKVAIWPISDTKIRHLWLTICSRTLIGWRRYTACLAVKKARFRLLLLANNPHRYLDEPTNHLICRVLKSWKRRWPNIPARFLRQIR